MDPLTSCYYLIFLPLHLVHSTLQARVILPRLTSCFECTLNMFPPQKVGSMSFLDLDLVVHCCDKMKLCNVGLVKTPNCLLQ